MPPRRVLLPPGLSRSALVPAGLSLLLHVLFAAILSFVPVGGTEEPDVVPVEFADLPRTTDFAPPAAGIVQGGVPKAPPPAPRAEPAASAPAASPRAKETLPPAKGTEPAAREGAADGSAAEESRKAAAEAAARNAAREEEAREARSREAAAKEAAAKEAAAKEAAKEAEREAARRRKKRSLVPSIADPLLARGAPGGRGSQPSSGSAVGTDAKAREKGEISEEGGGEFQLTTLNAPEVQYAGYFDSIRRKIENIWDYPYDAAVAGIGGELVLDFVVARSGRLESYRLVRSSGHEILDREAIDAVRKAAPFNPIPKDYDVPELLIRGTFIYSHGGVKTIR